METMKMKMGAYVVLGMLICLSPVAHAAFGYATFYRPPYVPSACYNMVDKGVWTTAVNDELWNNKAVCGKQYRVTCVGPTNPGVPKPCTGRSVVVKVTNYCPGCPGFDLSQEAFATIANPVAGKIKISYTPV